jgi:hypothetical protein
MAVCPGSPVHPSADPCKVWHNDGMTNNYQDSLTVARTADVGTPVRIGQNSHGVVIDRDGDDVTVSWTVSATTTTVPAKTWAEMGMTIDEAMVEIAKTAARAMVNQGGSEQDAIRFGAEQAVAYWRAMTPVSAPARQRRRIGRV